MYANQLKYLYLVIWVRCFCITAYAVWQKPVLLTDKFVFKTESGTFDLLSIYSTYYEYKLSNVLRTEIIDRHQDSADITNKNGLGKI